MLFFILFWIFNLNLAFSSLDIDIISREEWWALEDYRYLDSEAWVDIIEKNKNASTNVYTESEKKELIFKAKKMQLANNFLVNTFPELHEVSEIIQYEDWHKLAWPIAKSKIKNSIVVHHTDSEFEDSYEAVRKIYKYHSINKEWWDVWYNYLIWYDWEIFEWRAGGDSSVWAHDKWNNQFSVWIWMIWNYQNKKVNQKQLESLEKLIKYLVWKYNMDMTEKINNFKWCIWNDICDTKPIIILEDYPLIWHRDAWYTSCPWEELYKQLLKLREKLLIEHKSDKYYILKQKLTKVSEDKLITFLALIEERIDVTTNKDKLLILNKVKSIILDIENSKVDKYLQTSSDSFDDNNKIKVKLSYPNDDYISLKIDWNYIPELHKKWNEYILEFIEGEKYRTFTMNFKFFWNKLYLNDTEVLNYKEKDFFRIKWVDNKYLTITSWDRKPTWDKSWLYNDNRFRWDIIFYKKDSKLITVNELLLTNYLKWLWEVSNNTNKEKIKSIIVLARSYAKWYMTKAEKFANEWYHASDDPNVFQKYLWYWLEERSPNVNKIVDDTKDLIITYNWDLIKPWYFSSSDWYTKDFIDFCKESKWVIDCSNPEAFPFLVWVKDLGSNWSEQRWHWVWVPWTWIQYFAEKWWNFNMIIKYFLKGVDIEKM